ncbi:hypothetical protein IJE86_06105 [bacterium]|nr:hypothetical protein [bacterium]
MISLIEKEKQTENLKLSKPDFSTKAGREFLAFYLQSKLKKIVAHDKKNEIPIFKEIKPDFISSFSRRLIDNPNQRIMIAITGESASGKTTICKTIQEAIAKFDMPIEIISADNYFNDISELIKKYGSFDSLRDHGYDVDSPESFQLKLLKEDLVKLKNGEDIKIPQYLVNGTGVSVPKAIPKLSKKIVVVEGMATVYKDIKDIFDIKIFVDIDKKLQKRWFLNRAAERNQDDENALKHWDYVQIAAEKYVQPQKSECDVVINGESHLIYYKQFLEYMYTVTNSFTA